MQVSTSSSFKELGLDSLDTVEVVMAMEEEFCVEIPDEDADSIQSIEQAVEYDTWPASFQFVCRTLSLDICAFPATSAVRCRYFTNHPHAK